MSFYPSLRFLAPRVAAPWLWVLAVAAVVAAATASVSSGQTTVTTLQSLVDDAPSGSTVLVPPGVYRETVSIDKPLTLDGQGGASIRGSDVWTDWKPHGSTWISALEVPALPVSVDTHPACTPGTGIRCYWPEQVFVDGRPFTQLATGSTPGPDEFALVSATDRHVLLGIDPTDRTIEVTTRVRWVNTRSTLVTLRNLDFRHAGTTYNQVGALGNDYHSHFTVDSSTMSYSHASAISLTSGGTTLISNDDIQLSGQDGIGGWQPANTTITDNHIHDINPDRTFNPDWDAAGIKLAAAKGVTLARNTIQNNHGSGIWCDMACTDITIAYNWLVDNTAAGIFYEISRRGSIHDNRSWASGWANIVVSSSSTTEVYSNSLGYGAVTDMQTRTDRRSDAVADSGQSIYEHDNLYTGGAAPRVQWVDNTGTLADSRAASGGSDVWYGHQPGE